LASPADVAASVRLEELDDETRRDAVLVVERRWTVDALPDGELLDTIGHCYATLARIVREAHERCGVTMRTFSGEAHEGRYVRFEHPTGRLPCMVATARHRTAYWHLGAGTLIEAELQKAPPSGISVEELRQHYGEDFAAHHRTHPLMPSDERAEAMHMLARRTMTVDKFHGTFAWLYREGVRLALVDVTPADQQDKAVKMRALADEVDRLGADGVIYTAETWLALDFDVDTRRPSEREDRKEALMTSQLDRGSDAVLWLSLFTRDEGGNIVFEEPSRDLIDGPTNFRPILRVWERWDSKSANS
jgi:hypothetical protein